MKSILPIMAAINVVLIASSGIFILRGIAAIKRHDEAKHQRNMLTATTFAAVFLVLYVTRIALGGFTPFPGPHWARMVYYVILFPHLTLAMVQTPMVLTVLYFAYKRDFVRHRKLARITYPIWLYVSFTGVLVYGMLHFPW
jgi:putative membrane protein